MRERELQTSFDDLKYVWPLDVTLFLELDDFENLFKHISHCSTRTKIIKEELT